MKITHINPDTLHGNPAFSQVVSVEGNGRLIYVGGQNAVNARGEVVGTDLASQTEQALANLLSALDAAGATQADVVKLSIHIVAGHDLSQAFAVSRRVWGQHPCAITVLVVAGLANPAFLIEIEAVAAIAA